MNHGKFAKIIDRRYPEFEEHFRNRFVSDWQGSVSYDYDDIFEANVLAIKEMCEIIRYQNMNNGLMTADLFGYVQSKILEYLRYNPDVVTWLIL